MCLWADWQADPLHTRVDEVSSQLDGQLPAADIIVTGVGHGGPHPLAGTISASNALQEGKGAWQAAVMSPVAGNGIA